VAALFGPPPRAGADGAQAEGGVTQRERVVRILRCANPAASNHEGRVGKVKNTAEDYEGVVYTLVQMSDDDPTDVCWTTELEDAEA
jgi:hypothetical protein